MGEGKGKGKQSKVKQKKEKGKGNLEERRRRRSIFLNTKSVCLYYAYMDHVSLIILFIYTKVYV